MNDYNEIMENVLETLEFIKLLKENHPTTALRVVKHPVYVNSKGQTAAADAALVVVDKFTAVSLSIAMIVLIDSPDALKGYKLITGMELGGCDAMKKAGWNAIETLNTILTASGAQDPALMLASSNGHYRVFRLQHRLDGSYLPGNKFLQVLENQREAFASVLKKMNRV